MFLTRTILNGIIFGINSLALFLVSSPVTNKSFQSPPVNVSRDTAAAIRTPRSLVILTRQKQQQQQQTHKIFSYPFFLLVSWDGKKAVQKNKRERVRTGNSTKCTVFLIPLPLQYSFPQ